MNPIEKIEFKGELEKEKDLLSYISLIEEIYIPDFDIDVDDPFFLGYKMIDESDITKEEFEKIGNAPAFSPVSETLSIFANRYNDRLFPNHLDYNRYIQNTIIQDFIKELDLDVDKFWLLILFIFDYSYNYCIDGKDLGESPNEQLYKFTQSIIGNAKSFDNKNGAQFFKPISLKISIDGERSIIIDNPTAILYIADSTKKFMGTDDVNNISLMRYKRMLGSSTSTMDSPFISFFAQMFKAFFDNQPQVVAKRRKGASLSQKETDLICQLISFTRLSMKKCWTETENDTLKSFLRQYKDFTPKALNSIYPALRM